jgi:hypothetical protein
MTRMHRLWEISKNMLARFEELDLGFYQYMALSTHTIGFSDHAQSTLDIRRLNN